MTYTDTTPFDRHDHADCRRTAMRIAMAIAEEKGLRLTPIRARVLEILLEQHRPLGAYDILDRLRAEGHAAQPPVAYRALDFLVSNGLAHKLERANAYAACHHAQAGHQPAFLLCKTCGKVAELDAEGSAALLRVAASGIGFAITDMVIEVDGICAKCTEVVA